jgi:hypothetical protein
MTRCHPMKCRYVACTVDDSLKASRRIVPKLVGFRIVKSVLNVYKVVLVTVSFVYSTFDTTIPGRYAGAL